MVDRDEPRAVRRDALGIGLAAGAYAVSFGAISVASGLSVVQTMVLSLLMFTGASQFAFVGVLGAGGGAVSAVSTALLLGARNGLYGLRLTSLLAATGPRRLLTAHFVIDETTAMATVREDETAARSAFWSTGVVLFALWNLGTLLGALSGSVLSDPKTLGLDAAVPAAFVALLWPRLHNAPARLTAIAAAALAIALTSFVPAGVPVLATALVAVVVGSRRDAS